MMTRIGMNLMHNLHFQPRYHENVIPVPAPVANVYM